MNLSAKQFDAANARECATWSALAYGPGQNLPGGVLVSCARTDTQVLVVDRTAYVVIAFRGTTDLRDWITNAKFVRALLVEESDGSRCEVHGGFLVAYESIIEKLSEVLRQLAVADRPVFVTGHSLGGALAILAALELKRQMFTVAQVYTFGQPRVGNAGFAQLYNWSLQDQTFAVVNECDPVPLLPPLLMGYRDCGTEIFLRKDGAVQVDPFIGWEVFADLMGAVNSWRNYRLGLLPNHFIAHYQETLSKLA